VTFGAGRAALAYAALTVALTWPLAARLHLIEAGDSAYFAWALGWTTGALFGDPLSLPHANALHPLRYALFLDEPVVATSILALPVRALPGLGEPALLAVVSLNSVRLLLFLLTALATRALARSLGASDPAAFVAGALFAFAPTRVTAMGHLSVLGTQFLPLYLLFLIRWARSGLARDALAAGGLFGLSAWACGYHAVIAAAVLPIPVLLWLGNVRVLRTMPLGLVAALLFLWPLRGLHNAALAQIGYERGGAETAYFSAPLSGFLATHSANRVWGPLTGSFRGETEANVFPGLFLLGLALCGLFASLRSGAAERARVASGLGALSFASALIALGPEIRWFDTTLLPGPAALLREIELFRMIRVYARASVFLVLGLSLLAALGLDAVRRPRRRALLSALAILETVCVPLPVESAARSIDTREPVSEVYDWLRDQPPGSVVAELPMLPNDGLFARPRFDDSVYLVYSLHHRQRMLNGFAGIEPPSLTRLRAQVRDFPSATAIDALEAAGARYVILHRRGFGPNRREAIERDLPLAASRLVERVRFGDDSVLELSRRAEEPVLDTTSASTPAESPTAGPPTGRTRR
jgi:hypothetical protein